MARATSLSIFVECESCKYKFRVGGNDLRSEACTVNGNQYFLTYYDCPKCRRRHVVQADDAISRQKLTGVTIQLAKISSARAKGKPLSKKQSARFKKVRQDLSAYRMALMKELTGKSATDEAGTVFVLRFSV